MNTALKNNEIKETEQIKQTELELPDFTPAVNIYENESEVIFILDMPGVDDKSLDISVEKNILTVEGRFTTSIPTGFDAVYSEFKYGNYKRKFEITKSVDVENADAQMKNGQLTLKLQLIKPEVKKITVH